MSVQAFLELQQRVERELPEVWVILANPNFDRAEAQHLIAAFDTQGQAEAYVDGALLAQPAQIDGKSRVFKRESLLWDYNDDAGASMWNSTPPGRHRIVWPLKNLALDVSHLPHNPVAP